MFPNLEGIPEVVQVTIVDEDIKAVMEVCRHGDIVLEDDDEIYEKRDKFNRFHPQVSLLPAIVCCIQHRLKMLKEAFCSKTTIKKAGKELILPRNGPCPRVELPYTYLMAWFALYFPMTIKPGEELSEDAHFVHLHHLQNFRWEKNYMAGI